VADAAVQLRSDPRLAGTPFLVVGLVDEAGSERLLQSGVSSLLGTDEPADLAARAIEVQRIDHGAPARVVQGTSDELPPRDVLRILGPAGSRDGWRSGPTAPRGCSSSSGAGWCGPARARSGARRR
jgi:hypothetical protein